jgi:hypothetical protein
MIYRDDTQAMELRLEALRAEIAMLERPPTPDVRRLRAEVRRAVHKLRQTRGSWMVRVVPRSICEALVAASIVFSLAIVGGGLAFTGAFLVALLHNV